MIYYEWRSESHSLTTREALYVDDGNGGLIRAGIVSKGLHHGYTAIAIHDKQGHYLGSFNQMNQGQMALRTYTLNRMD